MNMQDIINWSMAFSLLDAEEGACEIKIDSVLVVNIDKNMMLKKVPVPSILIVATPNTSTSTYSLTYMHVHAW